MPTGFFPPEVVNRNRKALPLVPRCGACGLYKSCRSPKMPWTGKGRRKILVVAESPGETEDEQGVQLVGKSGQLLRCFLRRLDIDLDVDCWKTNALICCPTDRKPDENRIKHCRPNLMKTIDELRPETIVLLGAVAVKSLIGGIWREYTGAISRWVGWRIPSQQLNAWVCPTYHPAYLLRSNDSVLDLWFERHLESALELEGRPWPDGPPDYAGRVECIFEPRKAAKILRQMCKRGGRVAFDFETNMLKPDSSEARIISCAVCWRGKRTIAYPWHGEAIKATQELLAGFEMKIGANLKFEERWTMREFGHGVTNWLWDTMVTAHVLDNRRGITSVKFQAFVRLGQNVYDDNVKPYLTTDGASKVNRIAEVELGTLLKYNGMDALLEYEIAEKQMEEMGCL